MLIRTTGKRLKQLKIHDFPTLDNLVKKTVNSFFKKHYSKFTYHAFGNIEDAYQSAWTRLIEVKTARDIITKDITNKKGLLVTIIQRGLIDYMRSQIGSGYGRTNRDKDKKAEALLATTYYMDYYENEEGGFVDMLLVDKRCTVENAVEDILKKELKEFMAKRLQPKTHMIMKMYMEEELTLKEIGEKLYITESRVSQIITRATEDMRKTACALEYQR